MPYRFPSNPECHVCSAWQDEGLRAVVAETEHAVCLVPEAVRAPGALVVQPRRHALCAMDLDDLESTEVMDLIHRAARAVEAVFEPDGLNIWWATGALAGQAIDHLQVEIVPRFAAEPYRYLEWNEIPRWSLAERQQIADRLKTAFR